MGKRADNDFPGGDARRPVGMAASSPRRARRGRAWARLSLIGLLAVAGPLAGCGSVSSTASSSNAQPLAISSPVLSSKGLLPARYTCAGADVSPPMVWGNVPAGTSELALFLLNLAKPTPAANGALQARVVVAWALHGLKPTLTRLPAGKIPAGAVVGHRRYSICPPKGGTGEYLFRLYALPSRLAANPKLSDLELFRQVNKDSSAVGYFISFYTRRP
jgi:phosphatidylethanolamine-binding protein (PEBP) family uncharacterized protein